MTPLFESWLLTAMEVRLHRLLREWIGQRAPHPYHVVVNGWYFYSINWMAPASMARSLPSILWKLVRSPRRVVGVFPPLVRYSYPLYERDWREDVLPRYRAAVARAEDRVETLAVTELPALIDGLADLAGEYFTSIAAFAGSAYKMEMNLAQFYRRHLAGSLGGSHLTLVAGFGAAGRSGVACRCVARLVARALAACGDGDEAGRRSRSPGRGQAGGRDGRVRGPGLVPATPSGLPSPAGRDPAPRPGAGGARARADARVAGHATGGAAHRRGARRPWGDRGAR